MSDSTYRTRLTTILNSVSGCRNVYKYLQYANQIDDLLKLIKTNDKKINTWQVTLTAITTERPSLIPGSLSAEIFDDYQYEIIGWAQVDSENSSETTFSTLTESVKNALDNDTTLHTSGDTYWNAPPCNVTAIQHVIYGGVLCHQARITQVIRKKVQT